MKKILVVDDSEGDHFYNEIIITKTYEKIEILKAYDGLEALEVLKNLGEQPPELILLDINMPRMDGHEFLEEYHKRESVPDIPIIVMLTSSAQSVDKEKISQYQCVKDYLTKPITAEKLEKIEELISKMN